MFRSALQENRVFSLTLAQRVVLGVAVAGGVSLRWVALGRESLWFDEGFSWWLASLPPGEMVRQFSRDVQTPGHFLLLHHWMKLFGDSELAMRSLSAAASTAGIVAGFVLAISLRLRGWAMVVAVSLLALHPLQILHAREARYYAIPSLLITLAMISIVRWIDRRSRVAFATAIVCTASSLYFHNMMLLFVPALAAAWWVLDRERPTRRKSIDLGIALAGVVVLWSPWIPTFLAQLEWTRGRFWAETPTAWNLLDTLANVAGVEPVWANTAGWAIREHAAIPPILRTSQAWTVAAALALVGIVLFTVLMRSTCRRGLALSAAALLPVVASFGRSLVSQPVFMTRTFIPSSVMTSVLAGLAIEATGSRRSRVASSALAVLLLAGAAMSSVTLVASMRFEDWRGAWAIVRELPAEPTLLVFVANEGEAVFSYYASRDPLRRPFDRVGLPSGYFSTDPPEPVRRVMSDADLQPLRDALAAGRHRRVVLILSHEGFSDPQSLTERLLDAALQRQRTHRLDGVSVLVYAPG